MGASSLTIWRAMQGMTELSDSNYPHDPADFGRCKDLLDLIPEWRSKLYEVKRALPWFSPFIESWVIFEKLYAEEAPKGTCPKLYRALKQAGAKALELRAAKR